MLLTSNEIKASTLLIIFSLTNLSSRLLSKNSYSLHNTLTTPTWSPMKGLQTHSLHNQNHLQYKLSHRNTLHVCTLFMRQFRTVIDFSGIQKYMFHYLDLSVTPQQGRHCIPHHYPTLPQYHLMFILIIHHIVNIYINHYSP